MRGSSRSALAATVAGALMLTGGTCGLAPAAIAAVTISASQQTRVALPGAPVAEVFRFKILNTGARAETLMYVGFENRTTGPGTVHQLDGDWTEIYLTRDNKVVGEGMLAPGGPGNPLWGTVQRPAPGRAGEPDAPGGGTAGTPTAPISGEPDAPGTAAPILPIYTASFVNGIAVFSNLRLIVGSADSLVLYIFGGAALAARDGDVLDLRIPNATAIGFSRAVGVAAGTFPLDPAGSFAVNGMSAEQIVLHPVETANFPVGSQRNLALDVTLPANGYEEDLLQKINVENVVESGAAEPGTDLVGLEAWIDDGDGAFDPMTDGWLGALEFTGNRWELTALAAHVKPPDGVRVFVTVDIGELATPGSRLRLGLPTLPDVAIQMVSGNDGPLDRPLANPFEHALSVEDRLLLSIVSSDPGTVQPGQRGVLLFDLLATNTYQVDKQLTGIAFTNGTTGPGSQAERDGELALLTLAEDVDDDGEPTASDPILATGFFLAGRAAFSGFTWSLPAGVTRRLFLSADVATARARDGDVLGAGIAGPSELEFADPTSALAAWPLLSGQSWTVDGMVAAQVTNLGAAGVTLGPNGGPAPALDVIVPRNGYESDQLESFTVVQQGTAVSADLAELRLWRDGGNGAFDAGAQDDRDLGVLGESGGAWSSAPLTEAIGAGGARLFVAVSIAGAPAESVTVRLAVPTGGIRMTSDDDGPLDLAIENPQALLLSNGPLLASLSLAPATSVIGQSVTARMSVRNVGGERVDGISPSALTGDNGVLSILSGPSPASADLDPGFEQIFTWTYQATAAGEVTLSGNATGVGAVSGTPYASLAVASNLHRVFEQADSLQLAAFDVMPASVTQGQTGVIPLFLSFAHDGPGGDVRLRGLRVRLVNGGGAGIVPADLLSGVTVSDASFTYLSRTGLETSGDQVDLTLATPIVVAAGQPVTIALQVDVEPATVVPDFRVVIPDDTWFTAEDAVSGAPVAVALSGASFPVRSGLARVVVPATELDVAALADSASTAGRGQGAVPLLRLQLVNPGTTGLGSDVRVGAFEVILIDSNGATIPSPGTVVERLRVQGPFGPLADRTVTAAEDSVVELTLSPLLPVPVNTPVEMRLLADLAPGAPLGAMRLRLADSTTFDARDASTGQSVPVIYTAPPVLGPPVTIQARAETLLVSGTGLLPPTLAVGAADVPALDVVLRHPGGPAVAEIRLDSLAVRCVDENGGPLVPASYVERMRVLWNGTLAASLVAPPGAGSAMGVALGGLRIAPGDADTLRLVLDFETAAPATSFALTLNAPGLAALDANLLVPVEVVPEAGVELPLTSRLTRLLAPSRTLVAGFADRMPATLAADGLEVTVAEVTFENGAPEGSAPITLTGLTLRAGDAGLFSLPVGAALLDATLYQSGAPWAQSTALAADSITATLAAGAPMTLAPGVPVTFELRVRPRTDAGVAALRLGFDASGPSVVQPPDPLLRIAAQAAPGQSFPFWTQAGSFTSVSPEGSYSNFPNPFAAGREATTFAYYLPAPARVSLQLWSARGERVATLVEGEARAAGLQQRDLWDGRNGRGGVVMNGVYVAELVIRFDDGSSRRLMRHVAVVR